MTNGSIEIDIVMDRDETNNHKYITEKLLETKLNIFYQISMNSDKNFTDLVKSQIPEIKDYNNADKYLEKFNSSLTEIFKNDTSVDKINTTDIQVVDSVTPDKPTKSIEKPKRKFKLNIKPKA
uniref:Uncharacterized protein n=1 Tax=viral metagenome TaxID=1070528 RepID=A0A6C0JBS6_9ZZZZ